MANRRNSETKLEKEIFKEHFKILMQHMQKQKKQKNCIENLRTNKIFFINASSYKN